MSRRMRDLPRLTVWAWERPEDLRGIDSAATAIAYLDQTLLLRSDGGRSDGGVLAEPRMQPVAFPAKATRIAVVRIEVEPGTVLSSEIRHRALEHLLNSVRQPGIAAFQVDFDATRSQRGFYRDLLIDLRREMPPHLPLSMTALASWCSWDDWIRDLPVDEAVPMFFRMETGPASKRGEPVPIPGSRAALPGFCGGLDAGAVAGWRDVQQASLSLSGSRLEAGCLTADG
jgi:hypothetical protein